MSFTEFILFIVLGAVGLAGLYFAVVSNLKKKLQNKLNTLEEFTVSQQKMGDDGVSGIAVDEDRKKIALISHGKEGVNLRVVSYRDILSSEIFEDGTTVTVTSRGSQLGGALIGGLALGGVGAVIGGLSGKQTTSGKVTRVGLKVTVNQTDNPVHIVHFLNSVEVAKSGIAYRVSIQEAQHWQGLLEVLIRQADLEDARDKAKPGEINAPATPAISVADELVKLDELRSQGILTNDEFLAQKAKLLS